MHHTRTGKRRGFTLIELLVTIGIIAILAAILLPAIAAAMHKAQKARAQAAVRSIETALKAYFTEYSKFPEKSNFTSDKVYGNGTDNKDLLYVLRAVSKGINAADVLNPRRIAMIDVDEDSLDNNDNWVDPWDNQYIICFDNNFDNKVTPPNGYASLDRTVAVYSKGPDGIANNSDDVKSW